jgi:hypothetical protein
MMILSLTCSLVSMEMKPSFPSIPWGLLFTSILMPMDWETHNLPIIMLTGHRGGMLTNQNDLISNQNVSF